KATVSSLYARFGIESLGRADGRDSGRRRAGAPRAPARHELAPGVAAEHEDANEVNARRRRPRPIASAMTRASRTRALASHDPPRPGLARAASDNIDIVTRARRATEPAAGICHNAPRYDNPNRAAT